MTDVDRRVLDAVAQNNLPALILGRAGLAFPNPYYDTPTDPIAVFTAYRHAFGADPAAMRRFADAIVAASAETDDGWVTAYYLPDLLDHAACFGADFDARACAGAILHHLRTHAAHLRSVRRWAGTTDPSGCWGVLDRYVRSFLAERRDAFGDVVW